MLPTQTISFLGSLPRDQVRDFLLRLVLTVFVLIVSFALTR